MVSFRPTPVKLDSPNGQPRRPLVVINLLPSAATLGNLLCGFAAILFCLLSIRSEYFTVPTRVWNPFLLEWVPTYLAAGAWFIVGSMIFDALDGRLARMARRTSEFGAQLDSIADVVSFGAAPAMLFVTLLIRLAVPSTGDALVSALLWRSGLLAALVYVSCAAIRLARFNAENVKDESAKRRFTGLPVPGAAAAFVALILLHETCESWLGVNWQAVIRWSAAPIAIGLGMLMVSRLDYVHVFNLYFRRKRPPTHLIWMLLLTVTGLFFFPQLALTALAYAYVLSGIVLGVRARISPPASDSDAPAPIHAVREPHGRP